MIRSLIIILLCVGLAISAFLDLEIWSDTQPDSNASIEEWACLRSIEEVNRYKPISTLEFATKDKHELVCLSRKGQRIWVMLEAHASPFYKQLPADLNFSLSSDEYATIAERNSASETVLACLKSHVD